MSAEQFVNDILIDELNAGAVCCGYNYRFAKSAAADSRDLEELCRAHGILCAVAERTDYNGAAISSTRIRNALAEGNVEDGKTPCSGANFPIKFTVVSGDRRGRLIGARR